ncbi:low molecular weight phosphotyrosine protein phosphatase [Corynebacterium efficiens YS-314]|uniref:Putative arsenate reductase n=1 Tax=Corynebacterium efficiens (strain DSM 44549 / YS-314 / AJ 12310 / JCM 11189 / NBRC 100395) TaxID=196164 RepID=Q8FR83_COREF|nr:phosphotyrosine protein phosphatase [Corynebacterium efficiens]EEW50547.1 low molecular weight phosphotyrosine protein phosphatase [Corynebacterium efficiens YS-314]BAC17688.1 putative arsenate reductase [Corynebacterium efficiens YS-314]
MTTQTPPLHTNLLKRISGELASTYQGVFSPETIERYIFESYTSLARTAKVHDYLPVLAERFAKDRLRALALAEGKIATPAPQVLFVCVHNAGRSQIAAALLSSYAGDAVEVRSAGSLPSSEIPDVVVDVLAERGIDLAGAFPKPLTDDVVRGADYVITMGCGDVCPIYPGKHYLDWDLADPKDETPERVRAIVDEVDERVRGLWETIQR